MKRRIPHPVKHGCSRCASPLSLGLFLTACLLFSFSFAFYMLSLFPIF